MEKTGYLLIDAELGGPRFIDGSDAVLEIAMLLIPEPKGLTSKVEVDRFILKHVLGGKVQHFIIKPYGKVDQRVLDEVVHKPLSYYEENGQPIEAVAKEIASHLEAGRQQYMEIMPTSNWQGDVTAVEYVLSKDNKTLKSLAGTHNMLHTGSYAKALRKAGAGNGTKLRLKHTHDPRDDVRQMGEVFVRAQSALEKLAREQAGLPQQERSKGFA